jgi:hypothetical protein
VKKIEHVLLVTHRYDLPNLIVCLASIRYWYPDVNVTVVKNRNQGEFRLDFLVKYFNISIVDSPRVHYGKYYGSLEPYLTGRRERFIVMDTDTALTGPIFDLLEQRSADFVVDREVQGERRLRELYWDPDRIGAFIPEYSTAWFTFNNAAVCGTGDKITRADFGDFMTWVQGAEPAMKDAAVFPMADMTAINVVINRKAARKEISVDRLELMIYPPFYDGSEADLVRGIADRTGSEVRIIHWADQKHRPIATRPLGRVYTFYFGHHLSELAMLQRLALQMRLRHLAVERRVREFKRHLMARIARIMGANIKRPQVS